MIDMPNTDLIAVYGPAIDQLHPYKGALSGARDGQNPVYNFGPKATPYPILALEDDFINKDGKGLKKGFYEIVPDKNFDYFLFVQSGKIKAKIPITEVKNIKNPAPKEEKIEKKNPKKLEKERQKALKKQKKREYKYRKGELPENFIHSSVKMIFDEKLNMQIIIWEYQNTRAVGGFKI